ncbi:MAG: hypothetical protein JRJ44_07220 [Deltaproteobacteria bacterium]|nr:hypothetical protein [Deltaproteobacteria bacterium]
MKPVYFPLTFIEKEKIKKLSYAFKKLFLYIPSKKIKTEYLNTDFLGFKFLEKYQDKIDNLLDEYIKWANIHQGSELYSLFQNKNYNKAIISEIKGNIKNFSKKNSENNSEDVIKAGLFLYIAYKADKYIADAEKDIKQSLEIEKKLNFEIKGKNNNDCFFSNNKNLSANYDFGALMTEKRIESWIRFFLADNLYIQEKLFFITNSAAAAEYLKDKTNYEYSVITDIKADNLQNFYDESLILFLKGLKTDIFKEYIIIKKAPEEFFAEIVGKKSLKKGTQDNTIIGVF